MALTQLLIVRPRLEKTYGFWMLRKLADQRRPKLPSTLIQVSQPTIEEISILTLKGENEKVYSTQGCRLAPDRLEPRHQGAFSYLSALRGRGHWYHRYVYSSRRVWRLYNLSTQSIKKPMTQIAREPRSSGRPSSGRWHDAAYLIDLLLLISISNAKHECCLCVKFCSLHKLCA